MIKYHTFTATTDSNGFVAIPTDIVRPSTGIVLSAIDVESPENVTFHHIIQNNNYGYSVRCTYWDFTSTYNANVSKTLKIAYVLY